MVAVEEAVVVVVVEGVGNGDGIYDTAVVLIVAAVVVVTAVEVPVGSYFTYQLNTVLL